MVFGKSDGMPSEALADDMKELKNHVKLVELDLEKRLILLENSINSIQKSVGAIQNFETAKDALLQMREIKNSMREIEDTNLISKLETISNSDKLDIISGSMDALNNKVKLLSDAVDILSESRPHEGSASSQTAKDFATMKSEIASLKNAVSKVSASVSDPKKIAEISERVASLEKADAAVEDELKKVYEAYHEKISLLEHRISAISATSGTPKEDSRELSEIREDIGRLKGINKKLVETIENDSRTLNELKSTRDEGISYKQIKSSLAELSKKVSEMEREMNLDRAMYPRNIMNLEKEVSSLKDAQKTKKEFPDAAQYQKKFKIIEKSLNDISVMFPEVSVLKGRLKDIEGKIQNPKSNDRDDGDYKSLASKLSEIAKKVSDVEREMNLDRAMYPQNIMRLEREVAGLKAIQAGIKEDTKSLDSRASSRRIIDAGAQDAGNRELEESADKNRIKELESNVAQLKNMFGSQKGDSNDSESQKKVAAFEKSLEELSEKLSDIQSFKKELAAFENEIHSIKSDAESEKKCMIEINRKENSRFQEELSNMFKSLAEENKILRQEIGQLKQICAEIIKESREQPIIID